nr:zinc finger, CCHC-type [Tanacetum cinerariifolium]
LCDLKFTTKIEVSVIMTNGESVKDMTSKFDKLEEDEVENDDYICRGHIQNGMSDFLFDIYQNAEFAKALWESLESKYMAEDASATKFLDDEVAWWVDSGATSHVCKDLRLFQVCKSIEDGSFVKMRNIATEPIKGIWRVLLTFTSRKTLCLDNVSYVLGIRKNLVSEIGLNKCGYKQVLESDKYILSRHGSFVGFGYVCNGIIRLNQNYPLFNASACMITSSHSNSLSKSELWHARLGHVHYKRMRDMSKTSLIPTFDMTHESCKTYMLTNITRQPFKGVNREIKVLDLIHSDLFDFLANPLLGHNKGGEYYDPIYFQSIGIIHQTTAPYTPQQNGVAEMKNKTLKEMVNSMLSYSGLSEGFWGEAMLIAYYILNRTPNKNSKQTPYEIWTKKVPNLTYLRIWGRRAVVRLIEPKMKNLGEKGIYCIFIGYAEHSKCYRFYVIEPNDYVSVNSIIESIDDIFDEKRFTSIPRPRGMIQPSSSKIVEDKVEGTRDKTLSQREYCFIIEEDPRTLSEAMASRDVAFWKEAMKVDGSIDKYRARLVIQGFRQKEGIDFFDTYALVAKISTIRLLLALAAIHDLVIHQMDVKTAFLNGDLDEKIYMKQPEGWINNMEDHSSTSGWIFLLGGGTISWASKKQTSITSSTMESEFVALAAAGNEAEWLMNLVYEIPLWPKSISTISIKCDSAATLAKAYSQVYNGKSRHLGVRHSMIRELIMNGVISVEFVRTQLNLADHLTKGLARDLVRKAAIGMGLKST